MNTVMELDKMTPEQYQEAKQQIEAKHGRNAGEANGLREQALAALYHRTGWTQEELAKVEGCGKSTINRWLLFGTFLSFSPTGGNHQKPPRNLTERRFRGYWERTSGGNDRQRFAAVLQLMDEDTRVVKSQKPLTNVGVAIKEQFADNKWHQLATIEAHVDAQPEQVEAVLAGMVSKGTYGLQAERRKKGTSWQYRLIRQSGQKVSLDVLRTERGRYPWSATTLWRKVKDGKFPPPVYIAGIPCWPVDVLEAWEREQRGTA